VGEFGFKLPDIGEGTAEAEIVAWHVKNGDHVEEDQPLVDMMTEKATVELTSPVTGKILSLHGGVGDKAAVGTVIVTLDTGEGGAESKPEAPKQPKKPAPEKAPVETTATVSEFPKKPVKRELEQPKAVNGSAKPSLSVPPQQPAKDAASKPLASPAVRKRAEELGIKLQFVQATGAGGRITHADLDAYVAEGSNLRSSGGGVQSYTKRSGVEDVPVVGMRRQISERMQLAKRHIPHFSYVEEVDVTELEALRQHLNATHASERPKLTLLPFVIRALANILPAYPQINATFDDEEGVVHRHAPVHVGIATQTSKGLMVPVVQHAEARDLWDTANEIIRLSTAARDGKAKREELSGSTITITSLGPLGGVVTTPIINRPEVAIIGPNKITDRLSLENGQLITRKVMNLSSSFDHRVVDGYDAAEFIQKIKAVLEHPATLFLQ